MKCLSSAGVFSTLSLLTIIAALVQGRTIERMRNWPEKGMRDDLAAWLETPQDTESDARGARLLENLLSSSNNASPALRAESSNAAGMSPGMIRSWLSGLPSTVKRNVARRQAPASARCKGRPLYQCNDGLMGVWLRLIKNPDYSD